VIALGPIEAADRAEWREWLRERRIARAVESAAVGWGRMAS
jgi:hypothetical protein